MERQTDQKIPFESDYFCKYYKNYRNKIDDLFDSERYFINDFAAPNKTYLDIGCAEGGMYEILHSIDPLIKYSGVDIASNMIHFAKKKYPGIKFETHDAISLPYKDNAFDRVLTLGTTVHDQKFDKLLTEAYRVAREMIFFDIRLIQDKESLTRIEKAYVLDGLGIKYPYLVINIEEFMRFIERLKPLPNLVRAYGYWGKANVFTFLPKGYEKLCMAAFLIYKGNERPQDKKIRYDFKLPFKNKLKT